MTGPPPRRFAASAILGLLLLIVIILVVRGTGRDSSSLSPRTFEIDLQTSVGTSAQLFWAADTGFVQERSISLPFAPTAGTFVRLRFPLPPGGVRWLRFDPIDGAGDVLIGVVRLLDSTGHTIKTFDARSFKPANQIASITSQGDVTRVVTTPGATDPSLLLSFGRLDHFSFWNDLALVTPLSLSLVLAAAVALLVGGALVIARAAFAPGLPLDSSSTSAPTRWPAALWLTTLFLVVFLSKLALMRDNPSSAPFWDQWDGEAAVLFVPFHDSSLSWRTMVSFHNEHRIFFSRLLALGLLAANGQWDPRLEQVANAAMHSLTAVLLVAIMWIASEHRRLDLLVIVGAVAFALPFGWENTLLGFQSAFYFLLLFFVLALWLTTASRTLSVPGLLGWLCAACGVFTAASGVITPLAILGVVALKFAGNPREWRDAAINVSMSVLILALGAAAASPPLAHHATLKAQTVGEFSLSLARNLAWPWIDRPWLGLFMWLPLVTLLTAVLIRHARMTALERMSTGLGLWVVLNAGAIAYGRGAGATLPAGRYLDILSLGFVANAVALTALLERTRASAAARYLTTGALVGWLVFAVVGVDALVGRAMGDLAAWRSYFAAHATNLRTFMITRDVDDLLSKRPLIDLPYPEPHRLATLLQDPYIQSILPAAVRTPLDVQPQVGTSVGFVTNSPFAAALTRDPLERAWLSLSDEGRKAKGRFVSQPLACGPGARLKFQVSGYLGWPDEYLAIRDLRTGRDAAIVPERLARESWADVIVPCPSDPFEIVAIDNSEDSWFGFREPIEIGWASVAAESLIHRSRGPLVALLTLAVIALAVRWT
jgi:hypothetical protein